ncbi:MAG TPA: tetratricopeptide repeat protein [Thermoanaerobaculia bacterium]|jgi:tetratricopeptide (TPR) repeat protein|nr:tetratricopeptide repeat protein [Thermoanaerobaculia bacterium]
MRKSIGVIAATFLLGTVVGAWAAKKMIDPGVYIGKPPQEAALALLPFAKQSAENGSWENIFVGRVYYLSGHKAEGQAIFDTITSGKKVEGGDWFRIGKIYFEAGEWDKAKAAFDKVVQKDSDDADWLAEIGAYYNLKGDRAKAEELFGRSFKLDSNNSYNTAKAAGSYVGVVPD